MKKPFSRLLPKLLFLYLPLLSACNNTETKTQGTVALHFLHMVGTQPLHLESETYTGPTGDTYTVSNFKYYISNVKLMNSAGQATYIEPESYHLIAQEGKSAIHLKGVPADTYTKLELSIGVDEELNHRIDHQGDLDPSNEMVWDWNTGYKFLLLVGNFTGDTRSGGLVFHVGGDVNYKTLTLDLPQPINLRDHKSYQIALKADVNEIFQGPHTIDFDEMSSSGHGMGPSIIAENYSSGFLKVEGVQPVVGE